MDAAFHEFGTPTLITDENQVARESGAPRHSAN